MNLIFYRNNLIIDYLIEDFLIFYLFEINVKIGKVNRIMGRFSKILALQFFKKKGKKTEIITPWPWRKSKNFPKNISKNIFKRKIGLKEDVFTILVFGGSQGSNFINKVFIEAVNEIKKKFQVIHITGEKTSFKNFSFENFYKEKKIPYIVKEYEEDMSKFYFAADVVLARSGGGTISELIFHKIPSILIPFPKSSENHQVENAFFMQNEVKGANMFFQKDVNKKSLAKAIEDIFQKKEKMKNFLEIFCEKIKQEKRETLYQLIKRRIS